MKHRERERERERERDYGRHTAALTISQLKKVRSLGIKEYAKGTTKSSIDMTHATPAVPFSYTV